MPKAPKNSEPKAEEPKVESPVEQPVEVPVEVSAPAPVESKEKSLGSLGPNLIPISYLGKKELNGRVYKEVHLQDGTQYLLSEADFVKQHNP